MFRIRTLIAFPVSLHPAPRFQDPVVAELEIPLVPTTGFKDESQSDDR